MQRTLARATRLGLVDTTQPHSRLLHLPRRAATSGPTTTPPNATTPEPHTARAP